MLSSSTITYQQSFISKHKLDDNLEIVSLQKLSIEPVSIPKNEILPKEKNILKLGKNVGTTPGLVW